MGMVSTRPLSTKKTTTAELPATIKWSGLNSNARDPMMAFSVKEAMCPRTTTIAARPRTASIWSRRRPRLDMTLGMDGSSGGRSPEADMGRVGG